MKSMTKFVRSILAYHAHCDASDIATENHLYRDLGLTRLSLVLAVTDIEELEDVRFPIEDLSELETVGEFFALVSKTVSGHHGVVPMDAQMA